MSLDIHGIFLRTWKLGVASPTPRKDVSWLATVLPGHFLYIGNLGVMCKDPVLSTIDADGMDVPQRES